MILCRDQGERLAYAEEVLLPKADLDEKKQRIVELEGQANLIRLVASLHIIMK